MDSWVAEPGQRKQVCEGMPFPPGTLTACELSHHVSPHAPHASLCGAKKQQSQETMDRALPPLFSQESCYNGSYQAQSYETSCAQQFHPLHPWESVHTDTHYHSGCPMVIIYVK